MLRSVSQLQSGRVVMTEAALICVVDDDDAVRLSIEMLIESIGFRARGYASAPDLLADPTGLAEANCIVLDVRMPGLSGLAAQERLVHLGTRVPVIFVSGHGDVPMVVKAMRAGAQNFIQKPFNDQLLLDSIQEAVAADLTRRHLARRNARVGARLASLTPRELEVLDGMMQGLLNKQIAEILGISMKTVEQHRSRIMEKMETTSLAELVSAVTRFRDDGTIPLV